MSDYILFPLDQWKVSWNSEVGQSWAVNEQTSASGKRRALTNQTLPAWVFTLEFPKLTSEESDKLLAFFSRVRGTLLPFFYKDAEHYKCTGVTLPKNTDGSYQLVAWMHGQQEPVYYADKLIVYVDGVAQDESTYKLDNGAIVFTTAPASTAKVTADYEYWWRVVFNDTTLNITQVFENLFTASFGLKVVR